METSQILLDCLSHSRFATRANSYVRWYPKTLVPQFGIDDEAAIGGPVQGVYVHVPFCDAICRFCPFNKVPSQSAAIDEFLEALKIEIELYGRLVSHSKLQFVYFGGGTPSVLTSAQIESVLTALEGSGFDLTSAEVSFEAHPSHISNSYVMSLVGAGITRISSGFQAFDQRSLVSLGAHHSEAQLGSALAALRCSGLRFGIDLLYRYPDQSVAAWEKTLRRVIAEKIPHVSAYALVSALEPTLPERAIELEMGVLADEIMRDAGYWHYASCASGGYDFCLPSHESGYETLHWRAPQASYLGLGPGAFGFVNGVTTVNGLGIPSYSQQLHHERLPLASINVASEEELERRFFVLGFKTLSVSISEFENEFGRPPSVATTLAIDRLCGDGLAIRNSDVVRLTDVGRHYVDEVSAAMFSDGEANVPHPEEPEIRRAEMWRLGQIASIKSNIR